MGKLIFSIITILGILLLLTSCLFVEPTPQSLTSFFSEESIISSSEIKSTEEISTISESSIDETSKIPEINVLEGTFTGVEWGDYLHLMIEDDVGVIRSFFVLRLTEDSVDVEALEDGQGIRIEWKTSFEFLDPPGEDIEVDQVIRIDLLEE